MLDFVESIGAATGLPVGISRVCLVPVERH